ncbi:DUF262 domain-containing protein [Rhizobium sp. P38BS-XIX]|uniref:DUF262 domain-containing protein n=1 Tax=Rhizobium sp. P38BS-XIX TaxID=2726740 RepID=UPI0014569D3F|nr:DUF262 domain-containing protein [Rhizobium sp. P38BS-XIX]NLR98875.1 DUF262 domain-containing protein [Rhizobium sp. P38BS-XIX]
MSGHSITSQDLSIGQIFQNFYLVPDYQREYVWGEADAKGERGEEVEQFLKDIHGEFEQATKDGAPEYFIGTIVVCPGADGVFDLIDGQQRSTTSFLTLCALRDLIAELDGKVPATLSGQIAAQDTNWQGDTIERMRLDLQYEDASGVLMEYGEGKGKAARRDGTRSIRNLANAYDTIREFLSVQFPSDANGLRRFHGYFTNKVKLIRIETPNVSRALKIFETINDRGVGLDAMDLLKNLLFMNARAVEFNKLKEVWKGVTQTIYEAGEKPLRFLRYYLLATYDVDAKLQEEDIYDWLTRNEGQTGHGRNPIGFAEHLREGAAAFQNFSRGRNANGGIDYGIANTRSLGGSAVKQHFILLLAGRHLGPELFERLTRRVEELMFVWLIAGVPGKDYERIIVQAARRLRHVSNEAAFSAFESEFLTSQKALHRQAFINAFLTLHTYDLRKFRLRYLLAKITRHFDGLAYGEAGREGLSHYLETKNDIEHILAQGADQDAMAEFGEGADQFELVQRLGNLMLVESSVNRVIKNRPYSEKAIVYPTSQFLLARCQATVLAIGANDKITRAIQKLKPASSWDRQAIEERQKWMAEAAVEVWGVAAHAATSPT